MRPLEPAAETILPPIDRWRNDRSPSKRAERKISWLKLRRIVSFTKERHNSSGKDTCSPYALRVRSWYIGWWTCYSVIRPHNYTVLRFRCSSHWWWKGVSRCCSLLCGWKEKEARPETSSVPCKLYLQTLERILCLDGCGTVERIERSSAWNFVWLTYE